MTQINNSPTRVQRGRIVTDGIRSPNRRHDDPRPELPAWSVPPAFVLVPEGPLRAMIPFEEDEPTRLLFREAGARSYRWNPRSRMWTVRVDVFDLVNVLSARWPVLVESESATGEPITDPGYGWRFMESKPRAIRPEITRTRYRLVREAKR